MRVEEVEPKGFEEVSEGKEKTRAPPTHEFIVGLKFFKVREGELVPALGWSGIVEIEGKLWVLSAYVFRGGQLRVRLWEMKSSKE